MISGTKLMVMRTSWINEISSFCHESQWLRRKQGSPPPQITLSPALLPRVTITSVNHEDGDNAAIGELTGGGGWGGGSPWQRSLGQMTQLRPKVEVQEDCRLVSTSLMMSHSLRRTEEKNHGEPLHDSKALINTSLRLLALSCFQCLVPPVGCCRAWFCSVSPFSLSFSKCQLAVNISPDIHVQAVEDSPAGSPSNLPSVPPAHPVCLRNVRPSACFNAFFKTRWENKHPEETTSFEMPFCSVLNGLLEAWLAALE